MSFGDAVRSALSKYCCFTGRARRSEFWYFTLFTIIISVALGSVLSLFGARDSTVASVDSLVTLALLLPRLGVIWRRFHDIGKSGANYFWILVPLVGLILFLVWRNNKPNSAKVAGIGAAIGFVVNLIITFVAGS